MKTSLKEIDAIQEEVQSPSIKALADQHKVKKHEMEQRVHEAMRSAQYFIDSGKDAKGRTILSPSKYMDAAIRTARRGY